MRKILISLLLAGAAATPALAAPHGGNRDQAREDRQQAREDRQQAREERQQSSREDRQQAREERVHARQDSRAAPAHNFTGPARVAPQQVEANRAARDARRDSSAGQRGERLEQLQQRAQDRRENARDARELRQSTRPTPNVMRPRTHLVVSDTPRPGTMPPLRAERRRTPEVHWNTSWRNNHRYDWRNHRRHHRSLFHLGFYYDPFGWGYSPFQIGWRLWPAYYSNRYWINDPWMYRLPYAPAGYVWVRYWNDALLVDTWTGTVVDVIPGFFW